MGGPTARGGQKGLRSVIFTICWTSSQCPQLPEIRFEDIQPVVVLPATLSHAGVERTALPQGDGLMGQWRTGNTTIRYIDPYSGRKTTCII